MSTIGDDATVTRTLSTFASDFPTHQVPASAIHAAKRVLCDCIGTSLAAVRHPIGEITLSYGRLIGGNPDATIAGTVERTSAPTAAWINATLCNALDLDETFTNSSHPGGPVVWAALAAAELANRSGTEVLAAIAIGYDIAGRIHLMSEPFVSMTEQGPVKADVYSISWQTFGAVAAAGRLLGLDADAMQHAFGLAGMMAPMPAQRKWDIGPGGMPLIKYWPAGAGTQAGVAAALNAQLGLTGPLSILDGPFGFNRMLGFTSPLVEPAMEGLGKAWWIEQAAFKMWPACRFVHPYLTALQLLLARAKPAPGDIDQIIVHGQWAEADTHVSTTAFTERRPTTLPAAQFSVPFALACLALDLPAGPEWQRSSRLEDADVLGLMDKISFVRDPETVEIAMAATQVFPRRSFKVKATVELVCGGKREIQTVDYALGDPWSVDGRLSDEAVKDKMKSISVDAAPGSTAWTTQVAELAEACFTLDQIESLGQFMPLLSPSASAEKVRA